MKKINQNIVFLVLIISTFSCKSVKIYEFETVFKDIEYIDYVTPIYVYENIEAQNSNTGTNFRNYTNKAIDSIFSIDAKRYKIRKKKNLNSERSLDVAPLVNKLLRVIENKEKQKLNEHVNFSEEVLQVYKIDGSQFLLLLLIKPRLTSMKKQYSNTFMISEKDKYSHVDSTESYFFLYDLENRKIAFYGKTSGKLNNKGYTKKIIQDIDNIYKQLKITQNSKR